MEPETYAELIERIIIRAWDLGAIRHTDSDSKMNELRDELKGKIERLELEKEYLLEELCCEYASASLEHESSEYRTVVIEETNAAVESKIEEQKLLNYGKEISKD
tara:strand:+ start:8 stop:322 length:315 start_codon:yes stop_codon:yes gene_type:complete